jgi:ankyrin repeat protein
VDVLRALVEGGADINKAADDGETPLYVASHVRVMKMW